MVVMEAISEGNNFRNSGFYVALMISTKNQLNVAQGEDVLNIEMEQFQQVYTKF